MRLPPLYAVVDQVTAKCHGWAVPDLARAYLSGGALLIQVRVTQSGSAQFLSWCDEIVAVARPYGARVIVNDRADIAVLSGAAGVHVGQSDLRVAAVRQLMPSPAIIGLSTHTVAELEQSAHEAVSYIAVGPAYDTDTKDTGHAAVGLDLVSRASLLQPPRPVVAIGGITLSRAPEVIGAGATSVAVLSDLLTGGDPERRVRDYVEALAPSAK